MPATSNMNNPNPYHPGKHCPLPNLPAPPVEAVAEAVQAKPTKVALTETPHDVVKAHPKVEEEHVKTKSEHPKKTHSSPPPSHKKHD